MPGSTPSCSASSLEVHALGAVHANRCNNNELAGRRIGSVNNEVSVGCVAHPVDRLDNNRSHLRGHKLDKMDGRRNRDDRTDRKSVV